MMRLYSIALGLGLAGVLLAGCQTTSTTQYSSVRPLPAKPRPAKPVPAGATANAMAVMIMDRPQDTNGNGYPDVIAVSAYLFSLPHNAPMFEDGVFVFQLYRHGEVSTPDAEPIAEWRLATDQIARGRTLYGPTHMARLSLLEDGGVDQLPLMAASLTARFEPADGRQAVDPGNVYSIQIGRAYASRD